LPTIRGESAEESLDTSETGGISTAAGTSEGIQHHSNSGGQEEIPAPSAYQTALEPGDGTPFGSSTEEEFGALVQPTPDQRELMDSPHVERVPENIVVAKVESSDAIEEQLARIHEDELATAAAGLQDIYFEFDSWKITQEGKDLLEKNANLLQDDADMNLLIEGHCDQRGTQAYNIVLGKKRAIAIRDYLVALGVEPSRLSVVTYGKEKPFCTDSTEFCYQENRRGHLIVQ
ncbi:MAG: OmpA family protein, partial [Nitrospirota bacterium]